MKELREKNISDIFGIKEIPYPNDPKLPDFIKNFKSPILDKASLTSMLEKFKKDQSVLHHFPKLINDLGTLKDNFGEIEKLKLRKGESKNSLLKYLYYMYIGALQYYEKHNSLEYCIMDFILLTKSHFTGQSGTRASIITDLYSLITNKGTQEENDQIFPSLIEYIKNSPLIINDFLLVAGSHIQHLTQAKNMKDGIQICSAINTRIEKLSINSDVAMQFCSFLRPLIEEYEPIPMELFAKLCGSIDTSLIESISSYLIYDLFHKIDVTVYSYPPENEIYFLDPDHSKKDSPEDKFDYNEEEIYEDEEELQENSINKPNVETTDNEKEKIMDEDGVSIKNSNNNIMKDDNDSNQNNSFSIEQEVHKDEKSQIEDEVAKQKEDVQKLKDYFFDKDLLEKLGFFTQNLEFLLNPSITVQFQTITTCFQHYQKETFPFFQMLIEKITEKKASEFFLDYLSMGIYMLIKCYMSISDKSKQIHQLTALIQKYSFSHCIYFTHFNTNHLFDEHKSVSEINNNKPHENNQEIEHMNENMADDGDKDDKNEKRSNDVVYTQACSLQDELASITNIEGNYFSMELSYKEKLSLNNDKSELTNETDSQIKTNNLSIAANEENIQRLFYLRAMFLKITMIHSPKTFLSFLYSTYQTPLSFSEFFELTLLSKKEFLQFFRTCDDIDGTLLQFAIYYVKNDSKSKEITIGFQSLLKFIQYLLSENYTHDIFLNNSNFLPFIFQMISSNNFSITGLLLFKEYFNVFYSDTIIKESISLIYRTTNLSKITPFLTLFVSETKHKSVYLSLCEVIMEKVQSSPPDEASCDFFLAGLSLISAILLESNQIILPSKLISGINKALQHLDNISTMVILKLIQIMAQDYVDLKNPYFEIQNSLFLKSMWDLYQTRTNIDIITLSKQLCQYSPRNAAIYHKCEIDISILNHIYKMKNSSNSRDQIEKLFDLFNEIASVQSSPEVIQKYVDLMKLIDSKYVPKNQELFILNLQKLFDTKSFMVPYKYYPNCHTIDFAKTNEIDGFTVMFWTFYRIQPDVDLLLITDKQTNKEILKLSKKKENNKVSFILNSNTILNSQKTNTMWTLVSLSIKNNAVQEFHINGECISTPNIVIDDIIEHGQELMIQFLNHTACCGIFPLLTIEQIHEIYQIGPKLIDQDSVSKYNPYIFNNPSSEDDTTITRIKTFQGILLTHFGPDVLVPLYATNDIKTSTIETNLIHSVLLYSASSEEQFLKSHGFELIQFLLAMNPKAPFTFDLFQSFIALYNDLKNITLKKDLLKNIICNFALLNKSSPDEHLKILQKLVEFAKDHIKEFTEALTIQSLLRALRIYYYYECEDFDALKNLNAAFTKKSVHIRKKDDDNETHEESDISPTVIQNDNESEQKNEFTENESEQLIDMECFAPPVHYVVEEEDQSSNESNSLPKDIQSDSMTNENSEKNYYDSQKSSNVVKENKKHQKYTIDKNILKGRSMLLPLILQMSECHFTQTDFDALITSIYDNQDPKQISDLMEVFISILTNLEPSSFETIQLFPNIFKLNKLLDYEDSNIYQLYNFIIMLHQKFSNIELSLSEHLDLIIRNPSAQNISKRPMLVASLRKLMENNNIYELFPTICYFTYEDPLIQKHENIQATIEDSHSKDENTVPESKEDNVIVEKVPETQIIIEDDIKKTNDEGKQEKGDNCEIQDDSNDEIPQNEIKMRESIIINNNETTTIENIVPESKPLLMNFHFLRDLKPSSSYVTSETWHFVPLIIAVKLHNDNRIEESELLIDFLTLCSPDQWLNIYLTIVALDLGFVFESEQIKMIFFNKIMNNIMFKKIDITNQQIINFSNLIAFHIFYRLYHPRTGSSPTKSRQNSQNTSMPPETNKKSSDFIPQNNVRIIFRTSIFQTRKPSVHQETRIKFNTTKLDTYTLFSLTNSKILPPLYGLRFSYNDLGEFKWDHSDLAQTYLLMSQVNLLTELYPLYFQLLMLLAHENSEFVAGWLKTCYLDKNSIDTDESIKSYFTNLMFKLKTLNISTKYSKDYPAPDETYHGGIHIKKGEEIEPSLKSTLNLIKKLNEKAENYATTISKYIQNSYSTPFSIALEDENRFFEHTRVSWSRYWHNATQRNGPWDLTQHKAPKFKLDNTLCFAYCPIKLKANDNFDDHYRASLMRDTGSAEKVDERLDQLKEEYKQHRKETFMPDVFDLEVNRSQEEFNFEESEDTEQSDFSFMNLDDALEKQSISYKCTLVKITGEINAKFIISPKYLVIFQFDKKKRKILPLDEIQHIFLRKYLKRNTAIEIYMIDGTSYFLQFFETINKDIIKNLHRSQMKNIKCFQTGSIQRLIHYTNITEDWVNGKVSNFEYLMFLNILSGRSFNNPSQYPLMPWVLSNYSSKKINLADPSNYRPLSKPMGALNESRLDYLIKREKEMVEFTDSRYLYSCYSISPFLVYHWMLRVEPFTTLHIEVQGKRFDHAARQFYSIPISYKNASTQLNDYRELIPELYYMPEMFENLNKFDLGAVEKGPISEVDLPAWASNPFNFIYGMRKALESRYVSEHLNEWIDLTWGENQKGPKAHQANNTYLDELYDDVWDKLPDDQQERTFEIEATLKHVGQIPTQLFTTAHKMKKVLPEMPIDSFSQTCEASFTRSKAKSAYIEYINSKQKLLVSYLIENEKSQQVIFRQIVISLSKPKKTLEKYQKLTIPNAAYVATDMENQNTTFILKSFGSISTIKNKTVEHSYDPYISHICADSGFFAYIVDDSSLSVYKQGKELYTISFYGQMLSCLALSSTFKATVVGMKSGSFTISSLYHGIKTRTVDLINHSVPALVLITECWGFIICFSTFTSLDSTSNYLSLFNINGYLINVVQIPETITAFCTWRSADAFDYVAYATTTGEIYAFEAYFIKDRKQVGKVDGKVLHITYSIQEKTLFVVTNKGKLIGFTNSN